MKTRTQELEEMINLLDNEILDNVNYFIPVKTNANAFKKLVDKKIQLSVELAKQRTQAVTKAM